MKTITALDQALMKALEQTSAVVRLLEQLEQEGYQVPYEAFVAARSACRDTHQVIEAQRKIRPRGNVSGNNLSATERT